MDGLIFEHFSQWLPEEIVAEIENFLIEEYRRENAKKVGEAVKRCVTRQNDMVAASTYMLVTYKRDPSKETIWFSPYYDVCAVCGDPLEVSGQTLKPFWVTGTYDTRHLRKSHGRNCYVIAQSNGVNAVDLRAIGGSYEDRIWYY
ncbi:hypothetical protein BNJ_00220 [Kaumoebavirus]|uniref:hypothetical protein n=1 Tax=Kaumoebavirus TaxID=1859492 RepID=UPI0009C32789|nr:hypothetical protein BNJ_00220 [Kaumoebavirus]ARA72049.1 hypothetical protein BNJ_00220 [Kaumoebavirus]